MQVRCSTLLLISRGRSISKNKKEIPKLAKKISDIGTDVGWSWSALLKFLWLISLVATNMPPFTRK
jgi:hypothetical protein